MPQVKPQPRVILGMAVAVLLLGPGYHSQPPKIPLGTSDNGRTVAAEVGDTIVVALDALGPVYFGSLVVSSASVRFVAEADQFPSPPNPNPGGGTTQRYTFEAVATGRAEIKILRELEPEPTAFAVTAQVGTTLVVLGPRSNATEG